MKRARPTDRSSMVGGPVIDASKACGVIVVDYRFGFPLACGLALSFLDS